MRCQDRNEFKFRHWIIVYEINLETCIIHFPVNDVFHKFAYRKLIGVGKKTFLNNRYCSMLIDDSRTWMRWLPSQHTNSNINVYIVPIE